MGKIGASEIISTDIRTCMFGINDHWLVVVHTSRPKRVSFNICHKEAKDYVR